MGEVDQLKSEIKYLQSFLPSDYRNSPSLERKVVLELDLSGFTAVTQDKLNQGELATARWVDRIGRDVYATFEPIKGYRGVIQYHEGDAVAATFDNADDAVLAAVEVAEGVHGLAPETLCDRSSLKLQKRQGIAVGNVFTATVGDVHRKIRVIDGDGIEESVRIEGDSSKDAYVRVDRAVYDSLKTRLPFVSVGSEFELFQNGHIDLKKYDSPVLPDDVEALRSMKQELLSYFPPLTRDEVQGKRSGKRENATILFSVLPSLKRLAHTEDVSQLTESYDAHFAVLKQLIENEYGGEIDKLYRGKVLARFRQQDHVHAAEAVALLLPERLNHDERIRDLLKGEKVGVPLRGYSKGLVYVGPVGTESRRAFTTLGDRVNMAARLMVAAKEHPRGVLTDYSRGNTLVLERELKGIGRTRMFMPSTENLTRQFKKKTLIGRDDELKNIDNIIKDYFASGKGALVNIRADAGFGKTELTKEFERRFAGQVYRASAVEQAKDIPDYLFQDLVKNVVGVRPDSSKENVKVLLDKLDSDSAKVVHHWLGLSLGYEKPAGSKQEIEEARRKTLLKLLSGEKSLVVFNDLHWADAQSIETINWLRNNLPTSLILTNYRPKEISVELVGGENITLDALSEKGTKDLLEHLVRHSADPVLSGFVRKQSHGIPLYVEEVVKYLQEESLVEKGRLTKPVEDVAIPDSIEKLVLQRYRNLKSADLQTALDYLSCMFGDETPVALLAKVLGLSEDETRRQLHTLEQKDFVRVNGTVSFKHNLTRKSVYERAVLANDRVKMHTKIGDSRLDLYGEGDDQKVALAWDYENGDDLEKAIEHLWRAERMFALSGDNGATINFAERVESKSEEQDIDSIKFNLAQAFNAKGLALQRKGDLESSGRAYKKAADYLQFVPSSSDKLNLEFKLSLNRAILTQQTDVNASLPLFESALESAIQLGNLNFEGVVRMNLIANLNLLKEYERAIEQGKEAIRIFSNLDNKSSLARAYSNLASSQLESNTDIQDAIVNVEKGMKIALDIQDDATLASCLVNYGTALMKTGENSRADEEFRKCEKLLKKLNYAIRLPYLYVQWAENCIAGFNFEEALKICEKLKDIAPQDSNLAPLLEKIKVKKN